MVKKTPPDRPKKLPNMGADHRRRLFIEAYLTNGKNSTQAAIAAGFAPKAAAMQGSRLLRHAKVSQELNNRMTEVLEKVQLTTERTLLEIARLAYSDMRKFYNADGTLKRIVDLDDDTAAVLAGFECEVATGRGEDAPVTTTSKVKAWDKNSALEKAIKILGLNKADHEQQAEATVAAFTSASLLAAKAAWAKLPK